LPNHERSAEDWLDAKSQQRIAQMMHPLDGARLKVVRAEQHLDALKEEIALYLDSHPYEIPIQQNSDELTIGKAVVRHEPPPMLSCILGDCVGNLRASLDYVAWQIGTKAPPAPLTEKEKRHIAFPIAKDRASLENTQAWSQLINCGVPAGATALIESVQPYHAGYKPLELLNVLVNEDKHRLPLFTVAYAKTESIKVIAPDGFAVHGCAVDSLWIALDAADSGKMQVYGQVAVFVSLQNPLMPREPVGITLAQIFKCVANIIPRFESFV
jgi:hypothetical protein